jgi:hypothetical protein
VLASASAVANLIAASCIAFPFDRFGPMKNGSTRLPFRS